MVKIEMKLVCAFEPKCKPNFFEKPKSLLKLKCQIKMDFPPNWLFNFLPWLKSSSSTLFLFPFPFHYFICSSHHFLNIALPFVFHFILFHFNHLTHVSTKWDLTRFFRIKNHKYLTWEECVCNRYRFRTHASVCSRKRTIIVVSWKRTIHIRENIEGRIEIQNKNEYFLL